LVKAVAVVAGIVAAGPLAAQQPTSGVPSAVPLPSAPAPRVQTVLADTSVLRRPPMSPRRAFLSSVILPGYAQSRLGRPTASILFATVEVLALGMARKSAQDMREAERAPKGYIYTAYSIDPVTGVGTPSDSVASRFTDSRVRARHLHYEDWLALIAFNHIIAGADAYVAANLWDFKANVSVNPTDRGVALVASRSF
jgi:hypothetical protein